ncbi:MAG: flagellar basal body P-ring formation chaperone FlgA [Pseudomonadota bacterium]
MMHKYKAVIATAILASGVEYAAAEELLAARNIRAGSLISASDIVTPHTDEAMRRAAKAIGMQTARALYKGKPFDEADLEPPTIVDRNEIVTMEYFKGPLMISAEVRALDEGGRGERIRVINLQSKRIVSATIIDAGRVRAQ